MSALSTRRLTTSNYSAEVNNTVIPLFIQFFGQTPALLKVNRHSTEAFRVQSMLNSLLGNPFGVVSDNGSERFTGSTMQFFIYKKVNNSSKPNEKSFATTFIGINSLPLGIENEVKQMSDGNIKSLFREWYTRHKEVLSLALTNQCNIQKFRSGMDLRAMIYPPNTPVYKMYQDLVQDFQDEIDWRFSPIDGLHRTVALLCFMLFSELDFINTSKCCPGSLNYKSFKTAGFFNNPKLNCQSKFKSTGMRNFLVEKAYNSVMAASPSDASAGNEVGCMAQIVCWLPLLPICNHYAFQNLLRQMMIKSEHIHNQKKDSSNNSASSSMAFLIDDVSSYVSEHSDSHHTTAVNEMPFFNNGHLKTKRKSYGYAEYPPIFRTAAWKAYIIEPKFQSMIDFATYISDRG